VERVAKREEFDFNLTLPLPGRTARATPEDSRQEMNDLLAFGSAIASA
jgi:hypothetical protein